MSDDSYSQKILRFAGVGPLDHDATARMRLESYFKDGGTVDADIDVICLGFEHAVARLADDPKWGAAQAQGDAVDMAESLPDPEDTDILYEGMLYGIAFKAGVW